MEYSINKLYEYVKHNGIDEYEDEDILNKYMNDERFRDVVNNTHINYEDYCNWMAFEDMINRKIKYKTFAQIDSLLWEDEDICALDLINK